VSTSSFKKEADVAVVIVSYNTREMTAACIDSVLRSGQHEMKQEIVVIDNASKDGSALFIADRFPSIKLITSQDNLGFAKANNLAAREVESDYVLLLNPDTLVIEDGLEKLVSFARRNPQAGIWGGRTIFSDGSLNPTCCWRFMSLWSLTAQALGLARIFSTNEFLNWEAYGAWRRDDVREVDIVIGAFLLIRRKLWDELGGFDERFFMYAEEADLCFRAREIGARPLFNPEATIIHYGGASESARADKIQKLWMGKVTFIRKNWRGWKVPAGVFLLKLHVLVRHVGYSLVSVVSAAQSTKKASSEWRVVWRARADWSRGYRGAVGKAS
jgi:N-acetylglucosaminyl-diphospho-decaprenol L-rhamnosyltransferase